MGNTILKEKLYSFLSSGDLEGIRKIINSHPKLINEPITEDNKSNLIMRAAYLGKVDAIRFLVSIGADPNWKNSSNMYPLLWAAAKGHTKTCKALANTNCNLHTKGGEEDLNALDFAIVYGNYKTARFFYRSGLRVSKSLGEFKQIQQLKSQEWVDTKKILDSLEIGISSRLFTSGAEISEMADMSLQETNG